ncbi:bifunctional adenosylcobinamide kinase/adenosylcobinamide-phosphate guanylyltransferase [Hominifimenecus sp. rT4P-3]|uniref:bifunctional adenosylcobinamide kinase/adenosylcobinamide-phosphate guanylyltransferase n=1 Tax=Hominifimenecus sp. rT4P-3 TaxID=3242979 RepID=UPI003DA2F8EF
MIGLVYGGSGSGKSEFAENLAMEQRQDSLIYLATMAAFDSESQGRILRHRRLRNGKGFQTEERYTRLEEWEIPPHATVLLECLSNLAANEMFLPEGRPDRPLEAVLRDLAHLAEQADTLIVVSNDVFGDGIWYEGETDTYLHVMAEANAWLAKQADVVVESVHGIPVWWKGQGNTVPKKEKSSMQLITGGAYQGKLAFARTLIEKEEPVVWEGKNGEPEVWEQVDILEDFPAFVRYFLEKGSEVEPVLERMLRENPALVVVTREIGSGVVPMDAFDRRYRELAGRLSCRLAKEAGAVYRVACGLAQKIK